MNLPFLIHRSNRNHKQTYWNSKVLNSNNPNGNSEKLDAHHVENVRQSAKVVVFPENQYMF